MIPVRRIASWFAFFATFITQVCGQETETIYLSGKGSDNPVTWQFYCTGGARSGKWTTIPVPSCWELQGFGTYNYGLDKDTLKGKEKGLYSYSFKVPIQWKNKQVDIVFEGVMTDAEVKINGKVAGPIHQGAFYQFRYDIGKLLKYGPVNRLEVTVSEHSADGSVNKAERKGDFWIFGGIFRPVYLEAKPLSGIVSAGLDARADGQLVADITLQNISSPGTIIAQVYAMNGEKTGSPIDSAVTPGMTQIRLSGKIAGIQPWQTYNGFDNQHYINYDYGTSTYWHGHEIVFPTEFLHGLYDGGLGAGLYDFWELMWHNPRSAGGFLWVFADEGVVRTDKNDTIDTDGNHAPDGILGPYHEKEGSFYAIKEIWSPVRIETKDITSSFN